MILHMTSLLAETRDSLQELTTNLETEAKKVGLRISAQKTIGGEQAMTPLIECQSANHTECGQIYLSG